MPAKKKTGGRKPENRGDIFDQRVERTAGLVQALAKRAESLPDEHKPLFSEALEELLTSLEELQVTGEELSQQGEELAASRKIAEADRQRYVDLFAFAPDPYLVTDADGRISEGNQPAAAALNVEARHLAGKLLVSFIHPVDHPAFYAKLDELAKGVQSAGWEVYIKPRHGKEFPADVTVAAVRGTGGRTGELRWLLRDVTEEKHQDRIAELASFPEINPDPIVETDERGRPLYINPSARRQLPGLRRRGADHPFLQGLEAVAAKLVKSKRKSLSRKVEVDGQWFRQMIHLVLRGGGTRIRIYGHNFSVERKVEEALRASERDYRDLVENADSIILRWAPDGKITFFNRFAQVFFGYSLEAILGQDVRILIPERDSAGQDLSHLFQDIVSRPEAFRTNENENVRSNGERVWVRWTNKALLDTDGRVTEVLAVGSDATAERRALDALKMAHDELEFRVKQRTDELARTLETLEIERHRFLSVLDRLPVYVLLLTRDHRAAFANRVFKESFGDLGDRTCYEALFGRGEPCEVCETYRVFETGAPLSWEWTGPNGRNYEVFDFPYIETDGTLLVLEMGMDVTERKRAETELLRMAAAVEQTGEAVALSDDQDNIIYVNDAFLRLHALTREEVLGKKYEDLIGVDLEDDEFRKNLHDMRRRGETWRARLTRRMKDGVERKLDVRISAVRDASGKILNYSSIESDATQSHNLEAYVRQLQKVEALGTLAGGIAHDFNNILVPIYLNSELAMLDTPRDNPVYRYLSLILEATNRGRELIRQIIAFSRQKEQKREPLDIVRVVRETMKLLRSSIPARVVMTEHIAVPRVFVRGDATQIHQVIMNLGANAAFAMRDGGGALDISVDEVDVGREAASVNPDLPAGRYVRLRVSDTGTGMTPEVMSKAFDPFFTTKKPGEGTGMGLAVVNGIVKSHGGIISVSSELGKGTTFEVMLPRVAELEPADRDRPTPVPKGKGQILLVDDEEMLILSMTSMLERLGYSVTATTEPLKALEMFRATPQSFDLVITDQTMHPMTGEKLAVEILRVRPGMPILLCTGYSEQVHEEEAKALGITGFLLKPFSTAEIAEKIATVLKP